MTYVVSLLLALLIGWDLARQVKHHPGVFYGVAVALDALAIIVAALGLKGGVWTWVNAVLGDGQLAFFLLCVVMFTGCFKLRSKPRIRLKQVRQPLALTSVILCLGHIVSAVVRWGTPEHIGMGFTATCAVLGILLLVLGVTSVLKVQDNMDADLLARIQKCSYVFFPVLCLHAAWMHGVFGDWPVAILFGGILVVYVITRLRNRV